jgi:hypothetical protein
VLPTTIAPCDTDVGRRVPRAGIAPPPPTIGVDVGVDVCAKAVQATRKSVAVIPAKAGIHFDFVFVANWEKQNGFQLALE